MLAIYLILLVFLLVLFILFSAIVFTFNLKILSVEEEKELGGTFTVKWLFLSHTFLIGGPKEKEIIVEAEDLQSKEESEKTESKEEALLKAEHEIKIEKVGEPEEKKPAEKKPVEKKPVEKKPAEKKPEEKKVIIEGKENIEFIEKAEGKEKRGIFDRLRGKKRISVEGEMETKKGMTTREKLHWGLEAYKALRKPLIRLFSDMFNAIKIKNLKADLTFGLPDPADTGMLCGFIHAFLGMVYNRCRNCSFSVCPVFMESLLDFRGGAEIRIKLYSLIFPFIKFIFNWKTLSFTYSIVKEKLRGSSKFNS